MGSAGLGGWSESDYLQYNIFKYCLQSSFSLRASCITCKFSSYYKMLFKCFAIRYVKFEQSEPCSALLSLSSFSVRNFSSVAESCPKLFLTNCCFLLCIQYRFGWAKDWSRSRWQWCHRLSAAVFLYCVYRKVCNGNVHACSREITHS